MGVLDGKGAFITGGASGIGKRADILFAEEGTQVCIVAMHVDEGEKTSAEIEKAIHRRGVTRRGILIPAAAPGRQLETDERGRRPG